ncbi:outer membrane protein assembly factor BamB family protein [Phocaeicola coprophilus]|jgi:outer membrane protein assembly factor BamB|uniref:outer membrane protein assembly factor BamB family protein n=1 Tax=Phocaeicola coprophilus TaxID=387090 RepID=UPI00265882CF|nr:PQQ-binding-like beta-propeller repeat protein [Phocaeicola coprophilus]
MKKILLGMLLAFPSILSAQYTGKVYVDTNHNGRYDKGETLMKGISVSDGLNVVQTDGKGQFTLPGHEKARFVFITTPSGYKTENAYYHRIEGKEVSYDFGLLRYNAVQTDGSHRFIHISDTEIGEAQGQDEWTEGMREYAANEKVAFIIHTGDICYVGGLNSHIKVMNSSNMPETQVFYAIGNHDLVAGKYGEELFEKIYGPTFYSFEVGNVHYIVTPMPSGDYSPSYRMNEVFSWMANDLKYVDKNKAIYVFNHTIPGECGCPDFKFTLKNQEVVDLLAHNLKAWLYGHWHVNHIYTHPDNQVAVICSSTPIYGGIDHASSAFRVMHIDAKGDFTSDFHYSYLDKKMVIASIQNHQSAISPDGTIPLTVNAYSTASPVVRMIYSCTSDGKVLLKNKPMKQQSDFAWTAEISLPSTAKGHYVTVIAEAQYANGEISKKTASFLYEDQQQPIVTDKDWNNLLGNPTHTGLVEDTLVAPRLAWTTNVGSNIYMSAPVVSEGFVYVASLDENETGKASITKIEAATGQIVWKSPLKSSVRNSIAIDGGLVFAQDVQGIVYAIDTKNGAIVWQKDLKIGVTPALNDGLVAKDGIVYAGTGYQLTAFKGQTGEIIWQNKDWGRGEGCVATLTLSEDNVLIGSRHWGALFGNNAETGKMLWQDWDKDLRFRAATPAAWGDVMYVTSANSLLMVENKTGRILIRKKLNYGVEVASTPLVTKDAIIFGTSNNGVVALDKETLEEKWHFKTREAMILSAPYQGNHPNTVETSPVLCGNQVYIGASDGTLYALDAQSGRLQWRHSMGAPLFATIAISGNGLFAVDFGGNVYGFSCELKKSR